MHANPFPTHKSFEPLVDQLLLIIFPAEQKQAEKVETNSMRDEEEYIKIYYRHNTKGEQNIKVNGRKFIT